MKKIIKKLFGLDQLEKDIIEAKKILEEAESKKAEIEKTLKEAEEQEVQSKLSPKERATRKKEAWVGVLNTHVNENNIRNGFFELDWNQYFILKLKQEGYGEEGDPDEEIVDRWFRELCANVVVDGDYGGPLVDAGSLKEKLKKDEQ